MVITLQNHISEILNRNKKAFTVDKYDKTTVYESCCILLYSDALGTVVYIHKSARVTNRIARVGRCGNYNNILYGINELNERVGNTVLLMDFNE